MRNTRSALKKTPPKPAAAPPVALAESTRQVLVRGAILFAIALAIRALHFFFMRHALVYEVRICDAWQYDAWAQRIAGGEWIGREVFYQTPLYPYFLGVIYAIFGHQVWVVRFFQAVLGSLACVFLARAGSNFFSPRVGWLAGLLLAFYPPALFFDGIVQKASLDLLMTTALLWALSAYQQQQRAWLLAVAGAVLGAFVLNRENAAILGPLLMLWIVWLAWPQAWSVRLARVAAFCLGVAAMLLPIGLRNYYVGGAFLLTTSQMGPNFYLGNHQGATGVAEPMRPGRADPRHEAEDARLLAEEAMQRQLTPAEVSQYWMDRTLSEIKSDPDSWLKLMAWKWFLTWNTLEIVDAEGIRVHAEDSPPLAVLSWGLHFGVLCPLAALGIWLTRRDWRKLAVLYGMMVAFAAAITIFFVFARYRYPLAAPAALFAAAGLLGIWDRLHGAQVPSARELSIGALLALVVAIPCNWPLPWLYNDAVTYFNTGVALMDESRPQDAIAPMQRATALREPAAAYNNLGTIMLTLGDVPQARRYFEQAIQSDPTMAAAYMGLAGTQQRQGDTAAAIASFEKSIQIDPLLWGAHRALGMLELERGNVSVGIKHLRRFVKIQYAVPQAHVELANALLASGDATGAISELRAALQLDPGQLSAANNLAWILATAPEEATRAPAEALALAQRFCEETQFTKPELLDTLAAAYANAGQYDQARQQCVRAIELAHEQKNEQLAAALAERLKLYEEDRPYRDPALEPKVPKS